MIEMRGLMEAGGRVAERFMRRTDYRPNYTNDLALEGLLWWRDATGDDAYLNHVLAVDKFRRREPGDGLRWRGQPFVCYHFNLYAHTGNKDYLTRFLDEAHSYRDDIPRSFDGAVAHVTRPEADRIFVDLMQNYAAWMARAGWLSGDESFFEESARQYRLFRDALREPETGIWSQGRGFGPTPKFVSPIGWLRGQGWTIRGMVESLTCIPPEHVASRQLRRILHEYASDLLRYQDRRGMWHQVPHRMDSYQETTGTGFIVHYLSRAVAQGLLPAKPFRAAAERGAAALAGFVTCDGTVLNGSYGCGPLLEEEHYLHRPAPPGDSHTRGTVLMGLAGPTLFTARREQMSLWRSGILAGEPRSQRH